MGFSKGSIAEVAKTLPLYTGVAPVNVLAVNPTAEELSKIYGRKVDKITPYISEKDGVKQTRLDFIVKVTDDFQTERKIKEKVFSKITFFISSETPKNQDGSKLKVINAYGQTSWVSDVVFDRMGYPLTNAGDEMTNFLLPYKYCKNGEEELIKFLRAFVNIPNFMEMKNGQMVLVPEDKLKDCQSELTKEQIHDIIKGDVNSIKEIISYQPTNQIKVLFAVKSTDDNKKYQHIYNRFFAKAKDYNAEQRFDAFLTKNNSTVNGLYFDNYSFNEFKDEPEEIKTEVQSNDCPY